MTKPKTFRKGATVEYYARVQSGIGKIVEIIETVKGPWYAVRDNKTQALVKLRAVSLTLQ